MYYVSVIAGPRRGLLLGPFLEHEEAEQMVPAVRAKAEELDPFACFYAFGTAKAPIGAPSGLLNEHFPGVVTGGA